MFVKLKIHRRYFFFFISNRLCKSKLHTQRSPNMSMILSQCIKLQPPVTHSALATHSTPNILVFFLRVFFFLCFLNCFLLFFSPFSFQMFFILIIIMFVYVGAEIPFSELFYVFFFLISEFQFCFWVQLGPLIFRKSPIWSFCPIHQNR